VKDVRTKIGALALAAGLGGLGGFAISSNKASHKVAATTPLAGTKVIRRTIHAKPHRARPGQAHHARAGQHAPTSQPVSTGSSSSGYSSSSGSAPVRTGSSGSSSHSGGSSHAPVHTGSSGASGGGSSKPPVTTGSSGGGGGTTASGEDDGGGEVEHEGGD